MNKVIFTGPTQYLGQFHFTRGKIYDVHPFSITTNFILADNDVNYYFDSDENYFGKNQYDRNFITLEKWRELQLNKILI
jgi:hypothetical protein